MNDLWIKDIMTQKFLNRDATRLIMLNAFICSGEIKSIYKKSNILEYIYRVYIDHQSIRRINPDPKIRNINRYGISDIKFILDNCLDEWSCNAKNGSLVYDERYIYIKGIDSDEEKLAEYTRQTVRMLGNKYFEMEIPEPFTLDIELCKNDKDIKGFGKSVYRNRVLEDIQYCPLCEEIDIDKLVAVHILDAVDCEMDEELLDKNNGLIMCETHARDYIGKKFWFKENGFVKNKSSKTVSDEMHLSVKVKTYKRRNYIRKKLKKLGE